VVEGSEASKRAAVVVFEALKAMSDAIRDAEDELARIDAIAGDGDHGRGMVKGITFAVEAAEPVLAKGGGVASLLAAAGKAWAAKAGGTSGVLWGQALIAIGARLGDRVEAITAADVADAVEMGATTMQRLGKASRGDKTMLDALLPFTEALKAGIATDKDLASAWVEAADVATREAEATASLRPRVGRARPLAEKSLGTPDPGATSLAMCARVVGEVLTRR